MEKIDWSTWPRREAYQFFSRLSNPFYAVTFRQDVTPLYRYAKENGLSFYYSMVWACTMALNDVDAFHVALRGGDPVFLPLRHPSFTDLHPGAEQFHIVTLPIQESIRAFCQTAAEKSRNQQCFIQAELETDDLIYVSCLPWVDVTGLTNERDLAAPGALDDSIPRIAWGKFTDRDGQKTLGLSLEVNHRFIDGLHIGRFAQCLTARMAQLP